MDNQRKGMIKEIDDIVDQLVEVMERECCTHYKNDNDRYRIVVDVKTDEDCKDCKDA